MVTAAVTLATVAETVVAGEGPVIILVLGKTFFPFRPVALNGLAASYNY